MIITGVKIVCNSKIIRFYPYRIIFLFIFLLLLYALISSNTAETWGDLLVLTVYQPVHSFIVRF